MTMEPEPLEFTSPGGDRVTWEVEVKPDTDPCERHLTLAAQGARILQRLVPRAEGQRHPYLYDLLENEARTARRLLDRLPGPYPPELPRLIGYSLDIEEPFILLWAYRGEPASAFAGHLLIDEQRAFAASLFRAVRMLSACDVVHRHITPDTVRWDGTGVQLTDLSLATPPGVPRRPVGEAPWAAPGQRTGSGTVTHGDDMWSAGMVVYHTAVVGEAADPPDLAKVPALQAMAGVFSSSPPSAADLLARLRADDPMRLAPVQHDTALEEGRAAFDRARAAKHKLAPVSDPTPEPPPPPRPPVTPVPGRGMWWAAAAVLALLVLIVVVISW
ncbi:hypothetical protein ABT294_22220 [Nonomuraea sp. NPDC000554]|uniref:hypothetical protein n=1 Tax=Nonomuraea sp. NPDC000554 TaxID=3154259 RepID=UPI00331C39BB